MSNTMGDSTHRLGPVLGRILFFRSRGDEYAQRLRALLTPMTIVTATAKLWGLAGWQAVCLGILVGITVEAVGFAAGWIDIHLGGAKHQTQHANEQDLVKMQTLWTLERIETLLEARQEAPWPELRG